MRQETYLAVDYGGTFVKYGLVDTEANILEKGQLPAPLYGTASFVDVLTNLYSRYRGRVDGVAVSMPGTIDCLTGEIYSAGSYMDMAGQNLYKLTEDVIDVPITVENDGKCGALAEVWKGALRDAQDGIVVIIGTGLAGGIIKDRRLHRGRHLTAGELSCVIVNSGRPGLDRFALGMMGLTVKVVTALGMDPMQQPGLEFARRYPDLVKDYYLEPRCAPPKEPVPVDGIQIFRWVEEEHPIVLPIYREYIRDLSSALFTLHVVFDPDVIAVGGGVSRQPRLIRDLNAGIDAILPRATVLPFHRKDIRLVTCEYRNDANLVGAVYNYLSLKEPERVNIR